METNENIRIYNSFWVLYHNIFTRSKDDVLKNKWYYKLKSLKYTILLAFEKTKGLLLDFIKADPLLSEGFRMNYISELVQNFDTIINEILDEYEEINLIICKIENHLALGSFESVYNNAIGNLDQQNRFDFDNKFVQLNESISNCNLHRLKQNLIYSKINFDEQYNAYKNNSISKIDFILGGYVSFNSRLNDVNKPINSIKFIVLDLGKIELQNINNKRVAQSQIA